MTFDFLFAVSLIPITVVILGILIFKEERKNKTSHD